MCTSPLMKNVMLIGQDRRQIGAFIVLDPDAIAEIQNEQGINLGIKKHCLLFLNEI